MPRRRELATIWANLLSEGLPDPAAPTKRPTKSVGERSRRQFPDQAEEDFRVPPVLPVIVGDGGSGPGNARRLLEFDQTSGTCAANNG